MKLNKALKIIYGSLFFIVGGFVASQGFTYEDWLSENMCYLLAFLVIIVGFVVIE